jgi:hypothetical protein
MQILGNLNLSLEIIISETGEVHIKKVNTAEFVQESTINDDASITDYIILSPSSVIYGYVKFSSYSTISRALIPGSSILIIYGDEKYRVNIHKTQLGRINGLTALFKNNHDLSDGVRIKATYDKKTETLNFKISEKLSKAEVIEILINRGLTDEAEKLKIYKDVNGNDYGWNGHFHKENPELADELGVYSN